jgi:hypothetical protein
MRGGEKSGCLSCHPFITPMPPIHWRLHLSLCHRLRLFLLLPPLVPLIRYGWLLCGKRLLQLPSRFPPSQHSQPLQLPPPRPSTLICIPPPRLILLFFQCWGVSVEVVVNRLLHDPPPPGFLAQYALTIIWRKRMSYPLDPPTLGCGRK